jgi:integrase
MPLDDALALVEMAIDLNSSLKEGTKVKYVGAIRRLFVFAGRIGCRFVDDFNAELVAAIVEMSTTTGAGTTRPAHSTMGLRRRATTLVITELAAVGVVLDPAIVGGPIAPTDTIECRPASRAELNRIEVYCAGMQRVGRVPTVIAGLYAGGTLLEIAQVRVEDIDLDGRTITFNGVRNRTNRLDDWSVGVLADYLQRRDLSDGELFVGGCADPSKVAQSLRVQCNKMLRACGVPSRSGLTIRSIAAGAAAEIMGERGFLYAAKHLGMETQLTAAARLLGVDWDQV